MAKVFFLSPPYVDLYGSLNRAAGRYFPLGIGYIASYLRKYGNHDVQIYEPEAQKLTYNDIANIVKDQEPDVIGLTCATPNFSRAIKMAEICKKTSSAKVIMGGVHASAMPEYIMEQYPALLDCIVVGEGEETMLELVDVNLKNSGLEKIRGIVYESGGKIIRNEMRPYIENLDVLPFPARDLIPQRLFMPNMHNARYRNCISILTSRGCPFNCSFCAARIVSGRRYRMHSAEYVLDEMQMLKKDYNARQLLITDDTFTVDRIRLEKICRGMIQKKLNLAWFCFSQINTVDAEVLALMKKAGCYSIGFGVESSDEGILKKMGKPIIPAKAKEIVHTANRIGLKTQAFYILGSHGETRAQMEKTIEFSQEVNSTLAFYNMLVPYPGTSDFESFFSSIPINDIFWEKFVAVGAECSTRGSEVSAREIEKLIGKANFNYYMNPMRLLNVFRHIRTPYELCNYFKGWVSLLKQIHTWLSGKSMECLL